MAHRYGKWPHEYLELDMFQQGMAMQCTRARDAQNAEDLNRAKSRGPFTPVVVVG